MIGARRYQSMIGARRYQSMIGARRYQSMIGAWRYQSMIGARRYQSLIAGHFVPISVRSRPAQGIQILSLFLSYCFVVKCLYLLAVFKKSLFGRKYRNYFLPSCSLFTLSITCDECSFLTLSLSCYKCSFLILCPVSSVPS